MFGSMRQQRFRGRLLFVVDAELEFLNSDGYCGWVDKHCPWFVILRADDDGWRVFDEVWLKDP